MKWKIFQWMKFLFRHSSNSRKLSRQKFHNELACVFTAHYASKNADWNQQQLTDGGVLANRNSANHPYCFLSNEKKVQILAFLHVICKTNVSCPPPEHRLMSFNFLKQSSSASGTNVLFLWICHLSLTSLKQLNFMTDFLPKSERN